MLPRPSGRSSSSVRIGRSPRRVSAPAIWWPSSRGERWSRRRKRPAHKACARRNVSAKRCRVVRTSSYAKRIPDPSRGPSRSSSRSWLVSVPQSSLTVPDGRRSPSAVRRATSGAKCRSPHPSARRSKHSQVASVPGQNGLSQSHAHRSPARGGRSASPTVDSPRHSPRFWERSSKRTRLPPSWHHSASNASIVPSSPTSSPASG